MKIGVKLGPENASIVLPQTSPDCAEVWFRLDWAARYDKTFGELRTRNIPFGLHYWYVLENNIEPNLAYELDGIAEKTEQSMRETIDIAGKVGATYVNIHPGSYSLRELNLDERQMKTIHSTRIAQTEGNASIEKRAKRLHEYAGLTNVLFIVETLPRNELSHWRDESGRDNVHSGDSVALDVLEKLGKDGLFLNNDFGHTIAQCLSERPDEIYQYILDWTRKLAPSTKLIHLNTVRPPFNGTDSHNGVLPEDFKLGVVPNREQLLELLRIFKDREDVWIIPEPEIENMAANFDAICEFVKEL